MFLKVQYCGASAGAGLPCNCLIKIHITTLGNVWKQKSSKAYNDFKIRLRNTMSIRYSHGIEKEWRK